jgi:hypothetical protein
LGTIRFFWSFKPPGLREGAHFWFINRCSTKPCYTRSYNSGHLVEWFSLCSEGPGFDTQLGRKSKKRGLWKEKDHKKWTLSSKEDHHRQHPSLESDRFPPIWDVEAWLKCTWHGWSARDWIPSPKE